MSRLTRDEARSALRGVYTIAVTPFDSDGKFDESALDEMVERALQYCVDGLLIGGTYGEFSSMSSDERATLFRSVMGMVRGRLPVLLCSADSDIRIVRELTLLAAELGGIPMTTPPYAAELTDAQIVAFFRQIAALVPSGLVIYNAPGVAATLTPALIEEIAAVDGIIGIKQGELSPTTVDVLVGRLRGSIALLCASDLQMLGPLAAGFDGVTSTNSCAFPEIIVETARAFFECEVGGAGELHRGWYAYRGFARRAGQPQTVKAAMRIRGWNGGTVRAPLKDLSASDYSELTSIVHALVQRTPGQPLGLSAS